ncbi:hypothetical protein Ancab_038376 [Ancistrocladus abbreviatus]
MFHRKLFPNLTASVNETDCSEICGQTCTYSCYSYTDSYFPPSPLPADSDHDNQISPYVIIAVVLLASLFLLVSYYAIVVKYCSHRIRYGRHPLPARSNASEEDGFDDMDDQDQDHDHDPVAENPVWFITTVGLQLSVINSITAVRYKRGDGLIEGTECSVCLSEFQEGETLRLLPKCNHAFHIWCIDTWLRSHTNCPLCRAGIVLNPGRPSMASNDLSFGNSRRTDATQIGDLETTDVEAGNSYPRNNGTDEIERGQDIEFSCVDGQNKVGLSLNGHDTPVDKQLVSEDELRLLRRSISMNHLRAANNIYPSLELTSPHEIGRSSGYRNVADPQSGVLICEGSDSSMSKSIGSSSLQLLHTNPAPIRRSLSWTGGILL